jgi:hypothetical protein
VLVEQVGNLVGDIGVRVGPAAEQQPRLVLPDRLTELPGVLDAPRRPDALVAAEDHQRLEPMLDRAIGVGDAVVERMLAGEERHDRPARHLAADVADQVPQVVFLLQADGAVGEEDRGAFAGQAPDCVVGVDPRVHAGPRFQLRPRRTQFGRDDGRFGLKAFEDG